MSDLVGQQLGNYRLLGVLGEGSFATVYLGHPLHVGTQLAIKVLRWQLESDEVEPFRHEATLIARLSHPHLVRLLDFGMQSSTAFLVLEYAPFKVPLMSCRPNICLPLQPLCTSSFPACRPL